MSTATYHTISPASDGNTMGGQLHPLIYANTSYSDKPSQITLYLGLPCWAPSMKTNGEDVDMDPEHLFRFADLC